ncbi:MAG: SDR family NAD(P)-dependent oxidoreductase [Acidobacteriota bacterium]|jgi:NAD(P)-dependent dehydrogenase (short-subunit alcohol dehydrogenase family)
MPNTTSKIPSAESKAYIITGPTSGIGRRTALEVAKHGTVVLVGRDCGKLDTLQQEIQQKGGNAVSVVCDLSDISSVRRAATEIVSLNLAVAGLVNNAGIMQTHPTKNARGWDMSYATNHLGPFVLTEALMPRLRDGTNVVFVVSAVEDPERKLAVSAGFRGARYISAEASARGDWEPGGSAKPGFDAYATSKQAILAAALVFARENPRLHINAIEPGFNPSTGLGAGDAKPFVRFMQRFIVPLIVPLLMPFIKILSTSKRAAREITKILMDTSGRTGAYYDEGGHPMQGSVLIREQKFQDRVVAETRAFLAEHSG